MPMTATAVTPSLSRTRRCSAIGAGNLRAYVQGQDDVGHGALSN
jgi:hypothetical protein